MNEGKKIENCFIIGFQEQLACYGESGYNIIKAEEIYHKKHYSKFLKEYNESNY